MSDNLVIGGVTFSGVAGIKATDTSDNVVTFESGGGGGEWTTDGIADRSEPSGAISIGASSVGAYAFYQRNRITSVVMENACTLNQNAFYGCNAMTFLIAQAGATISGQACISSNTALLTIDIKTNSIGKSMAFASNTKLASLILRRADAITTVTQTNAFNSSKSTTKPIHVFVPQSLKATYESATNWSTWVSDGTIVFENLEGSIYESEDWWKS